MMQQFVNSYFYKGPEPETDPSIPQQQFSQSRVIDIIAIRSQGNFQVSSDPWYLTSSRQLRDCVDQYLVHEDASSSKLPVDRVFYENNWLFARSYLCRKFVKGIFPTWVSEKDSVQEDSDLRAFQMFLSAARRRDELDFSHFGSGLTLNSRVSLGADRLIYYFAFDWLALHQARYNESQTKGLHDIEVFKRLRPVENPYEDSQEIIETYIVRRRTCIASILKMSSTEKLNGNPFCPASWDSSTRLRHRRTLVLFNEFHSSEDGLGFKDWISPEISNLWNIEAEWNLDKDNEMTAIRFIHNLSCHIWAAVVLQWQSVVDQSSDHIRSAERFALDRGLTIEQLESLAQNTWEDSLSWLAMQKLLVAHQKAVQHTQHELQSLAETVGLKLVDDRLHGIVNSLKELEAIVSGDFDRRGQSISTLAYNIIGVRNAQAAQEYSVSIGRISWISFIFFPLIAVSGLFGMNVDVLADNPSIKWYFIVAIPFMLIVLIVAFLLHKVRM